jgi:chlorobactene glucosyltransferase
MILLVIFITCALLIISLTMLSNVFFFPRLKSITTPQNPPLVSILVPARNEAAVIGQTVFNLLHQDHPNLEIIVLDDQSTDQTTDVALKAGAGDKRLRIINGIPLPQGWLGKNWACHQLGQAASGDILIFTDADVLWNPGALIALMSLMEKERADLLTVWPTQITQSWGERLVVPLMALVILGYLPILAVHYTRWSAFSAANGQCLAFRREAYERAGGHASVKDNIVEDVALAKRIKSQGLHLRMADGAGLIACRMYQDWPGVRDGFAKNILAGHGDSVLFLAVSTVFHWLVFIFPWLWLFLGGGIWALSLIILGIGVRMLSAVFTRQRISDALLLPLSVILMTVIAGQSVYWRWRCGGPRWKGRTIRRGEALHE